MVKSVMERDRVFILRASEAAIIAAWNTVVTSIITGISRSSSIVTASWFFDNFLDFLFHIYVLVIPTPHFDHLPFNFFQFFFMFLDIGAFSRLLLCFIHPNCASSFPTSSSSCFSSFNISNIFHALRRLLRFRFQLAGLVACAESINIRAVFLSISFLITISHRLIDNPFLLGQGFPSLSDHTSNFLIVGDSVLRTIDDRIQFFPKFLANC
mmetsp:Transcript_4196/g.5172  ORF Transcript_4196/g.5172 Transcript_4196/m.5172 type:complete len:211 (+) Transcript_4196:661-1293(+)